MCRGAVCYGVGSGTSQQREPGRRSGPTGEARHYCWGGCGLSEGGANLGQATGGEEPLAQATGDRVFLVQGTGGQKPFVWTKGSGGLCATLCFLYDLQVAGMDYSSRLGG